MVDQFTSSIFCDFSGLANVTSILKDLLFNRCIIFKVGWTCFNWTQGMYISM